MIKTYQSFFVFVRKTFLATFLATILLGLSATTTFANTCPGVMSGIGVMLPAWESGNEHTIQIDMSEHYDLDASYYLRVNGGDTRVDREAKTDDFTINTDNTDGSNGDGTVTVKNGIVTWTITTKDAQQSDWLTGENDNHYVVLYKHVSGNNKVCDLGTYQTTKNETGGKCSLYVSQERVVNGKTTTCYSSGCMDTATALTTITVENLEDNEGNPFSGEIRFRIKGGSTSDPKAQAQNGTASATFNADNETTYNISIEETAGKNYTFPGCTTSFTAVGRCTDETCDEIKTDVSGNALVKNFELCEQAKAEDRDACTDCFGGETFNGSAGVWTAIGCIPAKPDSIVKTFITLGLSIGGGATFLLILAGAFRLSVSQGDPQATKDAKEQITSAIIGLVFIIFSITMLRFIGVTLFQIPGFGG